MVKNIPLLINPTFSALISREHHMDKYDVIIVGSGPAGMGCAFSLIEKKKDIRILMIDKNRPEIKFVSPVSGEVTAVNRGAKRKVLSIVVKPDAQLEYEDFGKKNAPKFEVLIPDAADMDDDYRICGYSPVEVYIQAARLAAREYEYRFLEHAVSQPKKGFFAAIGQKLKESLSGSKNS